MALKLSKIIYSGELDKGASIPARSQNCDKNKGRFVFLNIIFNRLTLSKKTFEVIFFFTEKDAWESCEQKQAGAMVAPRIPDAAGAAGRRRPSITIQVRPANGVSKSGFAGSQKGP